jgi:hypothetical protein
MFYNEITQVINNDFIKKSSIETGKISTQLEHALRLYFGVNE